VSAPWWQQGAIYQIYPRSFADSDGDGVGDLRGILEHLDHLRGAAGALGVEAIWLCPINPSPMADFGYDVADYTDVDPVFGTLADFDALLDGAHRRGIKVILDWVPNHTSDRHPWFAESRSGRGSARREWYVWRDPAADGGPPNNWPCTRAYLGPAWTIDERTGQYYLHSFAREQPDLNWECPDLEAAMHDVLRFWLDRGVDGFRLDAIHRIAKDPALGDNEPRRRHDEDWPTIHDRLRRIRAVVDEYEDRMIVGEVYLLDLARTLAYVNSGDELHLAHNFSFVHLPWRAAAVRRSVLDFERLAAPLVWPAWFLENHDHSRVATRFADGPGSGERRARVAAMLVCTLRGTPFLYQGQELALPDARIPAARVVDTDGRDPERAPLPWRAPSQAGPGAGFTTGEPWLPMGFDSERLCVERQAQDSGSMLAFTRALLGLRARTPALHAGAQRMLRAPRDLVCFLREDAERWLVALNFGSRRVALGLAEAGGGEVVFSTHPARERGEARLHGLVLEPDEGIIARLD
jgi:alpha-glucosidase